MSMQLPDMIRCVSRILTSQNVDDLHQKVDSAKLKVVAEAFCSENTTSGSLEFV
jgi:hypothetical protein